jgi:hypothetical protein
MVNNNVMQYSSYILRKKINGSNTLSIRTSLILDSKRLSGDVFNNSTYTCLLKSIRNGKIIEIPATHVITLVHRTPKKVYCSLNNDLDIEIEHILVAIIRAGDFSETINTKNWTVDKNILPYYMINFQNPKIVDVPEKKIKSVAMCTQFCYQLPPSIVEWVKIHEILKVSQIVLYDSTIDNSLTNLINRNNLNHIVEVRSYYLNETETCDIKKIDGSKDTEELLSFEKMCKDFVNRIKFVKSLFHTRLIHDDTSANDCYSTEGEKYEFITVYDLDEIVFPRKSDKNEINLSCNKNNDTCSQNSSIPFSLYDYCIDIVKNHFSHDIIHLQSIFFDSALYLPVDTKIRNLIIDLKNVSKSENVTFPINVYVSHGVNQKHPFEINKEDLDFIKNLVNEYETAECLYSKYEDVLNENFPNFARFFFLDHEVKRGLQSPYKGIHYTDNVLAFYTHGAYIPGHFKSPSWYLRSTYFLTHFRLDPSEYFNNNINGSIRKLQIDKRYLNYLIKNFTNFCD